MQRVVKTKDKFIFSFQSYLYGFTSLFNKSLLKRAIRYMYEGGPKVTFLCMRRE